MKQVKCVDKFYINDKIFDKDKIYNIVFEYPAQNLIVLINDFGDECICDASSFEEIQK